MTTPTSPSPERGVNDGMTFFLRCAACKAMYVAADGWGWQSGKEMVCWTRPKKKRKGSKGDGFYELEGPCSHEGLCERWDGSAWVAIEVTK